MIKKVTVIVLALIMLISFSACNGNKTEEVKFDWGTHEDGRYENAFFNFTIDLPEGYNYLTPQEIVDMNTEPDENGVITPTNINDIEDLSSEALVHYVYGTKYENPPLGAFNPYINIFSENMAYSNNLYNKEDYVENSLNATKMIFTSSGIGVQLMPLEKPWLGDRQFAKGIMKIDYDMFIMYQEMYVVTKGSYSLVILIGYSTPKEKEELYSIMESITIK